METSRAEELLRESDGGWLLNSEGHLERTYSFDNFAKAMACANMVADVAEREGHHPDLHIAWGKCLGRSACARLQHMDDALEEVRPMFERDSNPVTSRYFSRSAAPRRLCFSPLLHPPVEVRCEPALFLSEVLPRIHLRATLLDLILTSRLQSSSPVETSGRKRSSGRWGSLRTASLFKIGGCDRKRILESERSAGPRDKATFASGIRLARAAFGEATGGAGARTPPGPPRQARSSATR